MRFVVSRTSLYGDGKPCDEATAGTIDRWDTRTCSEAEFNRKQLGRDIRMRGDAEVEGSSDWRDEGTDHKSLPNGYITRNVGPEPVWFIEIDSLDELIAFQEKQGDLVLTESTWNSDEPAIEIYDGWRE